MNSQEAATLLRRRCLCYICNSSTSCPPCQQNNWAASESLRIAINMFCLVMGRARRRLRHGVTASLILFLKNIQKSSFSGLQITINKPSEYIILKLYPLRSPPALLGRFSNSLSCQGDQDQIQDSAVVVTNWCASHS